MTHKLTQTLLVALAALVLFAPAADAGKRDVIFKIEDPRGDDHGDGRLVYPVRTEFEKGDLDLLSLSARSVKGGTEFEARFARPIRVAKREAVDGLGTSLSSVARHGFYTFNIDIYIDMDRVPGSGGIGTLPGRKAQISPDHAWDRAVVLTPRPHAAKSALEGMMLEAVTKELRTGEYGEQEEDAYVTEAMMMKKRLPEDLARRIYFPNRVRVRGNEVSFFVPDLFLGGEAQADWSYVVMVSGADLVQSLDLTAAAGLADAREDHLMVLPISPGTWQDRFGGGREYAEQMQPPLVDIIVPEGREQERVLSDFSGRDHRPVVLDGVVPSTPEESSGSGVVGAGR